MAKYFHEKVTSVPEVKRFAVDCFLAVGVPRQQAEVMSDMLVEADYRGIHSNGMNKLEAYISDIQNGVVNFRSMPKILKENVSTAWVDGQNSLGPIVGNFCMDLAISKCRRTGVGWVSVKGSNHFGVACYYSNRASKNGFIGFAFSNASPMLTPTRAKGAALGTNPMAIAAPAGETDSFSLDMSTATVAAGKIEIYKKKRISIPEGWAFNTHGEMETDADTAYKAGRLLPLGGMEETGGHKGSGLSMMVDIFSGVLSGSQYGPHIRRWGDRTRIADLGQCFVALNPSCFASGFETRFGNLLNHIRQMEPADPERLVCVPGDPERDHMGAVDRQGGIRYIQAMHDTFSQLAATLKVKPMFAK